MSHRIEVTESVPGTVFALRRSVRTERIGEDIGAGMAEMYSRLEAAGLRPIGPPAVTYLDQPAPGRSMAVDIQVAVAPGTAHAELGGGARVVGRYARPVARTIHHGDYASIGAAYQALEEWIGGHAYRSGRAAHRDLLRRSRRRA